LLQEALHLREDQLIPLMKDLIAAQLVVEKAPDQFAFRHALTREAIYSQLLARERRSLHRVLAEALEALEALEAFSVAA
jgi:predicted ATPase